MEGQKENKDNIKPFNGNKYGIWKYRIRSLIDDENALEVIDKEPPEKITDEWKKLDKIARSIIVKNLSDTMIVFATANPTAREIFIKLDNVYERKSLTSQLAIEKKLLTFKFKGDTPIASHFMAFEELLSEYEATAEKLSETSKIMRLLLTLPSSYDVVVTAIQTIPDNSLNLGIVKNRLLDYETELQTKMGEVSGKVLHAGIQNNKQKTNNAFKINKKVNRTNNFKKPYYKNQKEYTNKYKKGGQYNKTNFKKCEHCGRRNHEKKDCFYYKKSCETVNDQQRTIQSVQMHTDSGSFAFMNSVGTLINNMSSDPTKLTFLLDSGATDHLVHQLNVFTTIEDLDVPLKITIAKKGEFITASKRGTIDVISNHGVKGVLENVLYAPEIPYNLLSVKRIQEAGMTAIFDANGEVLIKRGNKTIISGKPINNLILIIFTINNNMCNQITTDRNTYKLWHERLGHIGKSKFLDIKRNQLLENCHLLKSIEPIDEICEACVYGKQAQLPFSKEKDKSNITRPLFVIHSDVCGPITPSTIDDKNYFITFIDGYTHYTVVYLLSHRSEVFKVFQDYVNKCETHFNSKIAYLYCDNGTEYRSNDFKAFCTMKGIQYHLTVPYTPQQNSVAERMNRTLVEKARSMIYGAMLDQNLWGEAVLTATYLLNLIPTKAIPQDKTPYELWHNKKPRFDHLKIFGCAVYILDKTKKNKFDKRSFKGVLVGYQQNGYKVLDTESNKIIIARDVIFDEVNFKNSRQSVQTKEITHEGPSEKIQKMNDEDILDISQEKSNESLSEIGNLYKTQHLEKGTPPNQSGIVNVDKNSNNNKIQIERRSERIKKMPVVSYNEDYCLHIYANSILNNIPNSYSEIKNRDDQFQWEKAIKEEIDSLIDNKTWDLVPYPTNKNIVDCRWIFTIKNDADGNPAKYKARLVARGFSQQYLLDYNETFAPVARITTFRLILAFANQNNLLIHQMDVKTAFLNGFLEEEIYMKIPEGIEAPENHVCKLNKALYGLKQSARCWFQRFDEVLKNRGFVNSSVDRCLYILDKNDVIRNIYVILYVDDLLIVTFDEITLTNFKQYLMKQFSMKDLKEIKFFLGINIERKDGIITLDQNTYLKTVLKRFNMVDCREVNTPLPTKLNYKALDSDEYYDAPCKNLIGCLMYAMLCTRPDLCLALNLLSRYQKKNNRELWQNLKRVLRYIKGTLNFRLTYKKTIYTELLTGYADADWANNEIDRKSTTGYLFKLYNNNTISWNTKRQNSVATSSTEAEYMALCEAVKEACWLKSLLSSIKLEVLEPITIFEDNNGCIALANNPIDHKRSKHIDIKYHFTRDKVEEKIVKITYMPTGKQLADVFTKSLPVMQFSNICDQIGLKKY